MSVSVGLLGAGFIGGLHMTNIRRHIPGLDLRVVADPAPRARQEVEALGVKHVEDWRAVVDDPSIDAVVVCSPAEDHPEHVAAAAAAGKHIYCEKPIALTVEGADAAIGAAERAGVLLQLGFNRRFDPNFAAMRERVERGAVGRPLIVRITSRDPELPPSSYTRAPGKMLMDTTIHDFDMARFLAGEEIVEVSAFSAALIDTHAAEVNDADTATVMLRFASGAVGVIDNCRKATYGYDQRAEVHGAEGLLRTDNVTELTTVLADQGGFHHAPLPRFFPERYAASFVRALADFADAIENNTPPAVSGWDGRQALVAALAAHRSAVEARTIKITEIAA
ncbi:inositol 2-dehydrogenase [Streptomyces coffeae]|uniref:Inositol 2-dehydrogenase n=1 Tax=Streptomyces coffeae TaxID=621382 RepID=A0ABS1NS71_9ACTN|nr:inositol 2-dehydrogenase [Streptomyces coffeae]MBL1102596.1 inositol 2-dehydrogenase [Streptomyces coffeae]